MFNIVEFDISMAEECAELYAKVYAQEPWNEKWDSVDPIIRFIQAHHANNYFLGVVALLDEKVVGASIGFFKPWIEGMEYYIDELYIDPDLQGHGLGTKLMTRIKELVKAKNAPAIILNTSRGFPSQHFYEKLGFTMDKDLIIMHIIL